MDLLFSAQNNLPRLCDRRNRFQLIVRSPSSFFFVPCSAEPVDRVDIEHFDVVADVGGVDGVGSGCNTKSLKFNFTTSGIVAAYLQIVPINRCYDFEFETRFSRLN